MASRTHYFWEVYKPTMNYHFQRLAGQFFHSPLIFTIRAWIWRVIFMPYLISVLVLYLGAQIIMIFSGNLTRNYRTFYPFALAFWLVIPWQNYYNVERGYNFPMNHFKTVFLANVLWNLTGMSILASIVHVIMGILQTLTIFGWPNAIAHFTLAWMVFWPFGYYYKRSKIPRLLPPDPRLTCLQEFLNYQALYLEEEQISQSMQNVE
eukprot:Phypoly_transcript_20892.p1 GENE.Phypoly_transcript_20892~~Phypoly_transcript_20892.p1  ORF type:complete len:217 (+),score=8.21 Phypoly_transcript_20892:33-653(+)